MPALYFLVKFINSTTIQTSMEKKEGEQGSNNIHKSQQLEQLREMSLLSLSHTPDDQFDEIIKIIKNFLGFYFDFKHEYTYSELKERALKYGLDEATREKLNRFIDQLCEILYKKDEVTEKDSIKVKEEFQRIIDALVPLGDKQPHSMITSREKTKFHLFGLLKPRKPKVLEMLEREPKQITIEEAKPEVKVTKPEVKLPKIKPKQTSKPVEPKKPVAVTKQAPSKEINKLKAQIATLEKLVERASKRGKANPFLQLELESLKGDFNLFVVDPEAIDKNTIVEKIATIKSRLNS